MEQENINTEAQEQTTTPSEWVTPTFERVPLNEALGSGSQIGLFDGAYISS